MKVHDIVVFIWCVGALWPAFIRKFILVVTFSANFKYIVCLIVEFVCLLRLFVCCVCLMHLFRLNLKCCTSDPV